MMDFTRVIGPRGHHVEHRQCSMLQVVEFQTPYPEIGSRIVYAGCGPPESAVVMHDGSTNKAMIGIVAVKGPVLH